MKEYISQKLETVNINGTEYDVNLLVESGEEHKVPCDYCCFRHDLSPCGEYCEDLGYPFIFSLEIFLTEVNPE